MIQLLINQVKSIQKQKGKMAFRTLLSVILLAQPACYAKADEDDIVSGLTQSITVGDLNGIAPSESVCTTDKPTTDNSKIFFLYNIGTGMFLSPGGFWGTHTSLSDVGFKMWLEANNDGKYDSFNIRTTLMTEEDKGKDEKEVKRYVKYNDSNSSLYMDHDKSTNNGITNNYGWYFEAVTDDGYTANNHVYRLCTRNADGTKTIYMTANPTNTYPNYVTGQDKQVDKNQYWKLISLQEYYTLFKQTPAQLKSPTDATFILKDPNFHVNNMYLSNWEVQYTDKETFRFGGTKCNKLIDGKEYSDYSKYQQNDGIYFFAFSKNGNNDGIRQIVPVHKAGWYIFNCNGFSSANTSSEQSNVMLYVTPTDEEGKTTDWPKAHATPLNVVSYEEAKSLMENESENIGTNPDAKINGEVAAGKAFAEGKYENQVMFYVDNATQDKPVYLQFGINIKDHTLSNNTEWTAFGDFRMYYAGERQQPDLVLDEDRNSLDYLTTTTNEDYDNVTLHLNRTFTLNKWNSLILPVTLTCGQMKKAFGDGVKVAKLWRLTDNTIQFKTVTCKEDADTMLNAFEPYIIIPCKDQDITPAYTAILTKADNTGSIDVTIKENHYDISMVSLKRADIEKNVHINGDSNSATGNYNWSTKFAETGSGEAGTLTCYGTMGKTFNSNGVIAGYDNFSGAYYMQKGEMWHVPNNKQYGLKGFRCWFRLTDKSAETAASKEVALWLDGVNMTNGTTGIEDIINDEPFNTTTSYKAGSHAVYNLNGQQIRQGTSTEGLPTGIYVVGGKKVIVK